MKKHVYFVDFVGDFWPSPGQVEPYFLTSEGRVRFFDGRNDSWGLSAEGVDGTERPPAAGARIDVDLTIVGHRDLGILLNYRKRGGGRKDTYYSRGDLTRLDQHTETVHGDYLPVGLFIPFERAWTAVKEFIEREGALPTGIEWISSNEIPDSAFPQPTAAP